MVCQTNEELAEIIAQVRALTSKGKVADYIPALAKVNKNDVSAAVFDVTKKECLYAGDYEHRFTLQSISKVLVLALVIEDNGVEEVFQRVGMEPTGDPFNSMIKLETSTTSKPLNPMINAGALAVTSMVKGCNNSERWNRILHFIARLSGERQLAFNADVAKSEFETAYLNRSLCYYMKQNDVISGDVEALIDLYTKQCAIEMNCLSLARIGGVFASNGTDPETGEQLISPEIARICKTFMVTCGMYNASGEFAIKVGIPAKSGVSGGIVGCVPDKCGIGIFSPALDERGNSIAGLQILKLLAEKKQFSIF